MKAILNTLPAAILVLVMSGQTFGQNKALQCSIIRPVFVKKPTVMKTYSVSGTIKHTVPYCGGAKPPDEILEQARKPKPLPDCKIHLFHNGLEIAQTKTAGNGFFTFTLKKGKYEMFVAEQLIPLKARLQYFHQNGFRVNDDIYALWQKTPCLTFEVTDKDLANLTCVFRRSCDCSSLCGSVYNPSAYTKP